MEQLTVLKKNIKCYFCGVRKNDYLRYGPLYRLGKITVHYYCLLLSNRLIQNGNDDEGVLGFLLSDIQEELKRTSGILCIYCKKRNATITCAANKCKRTFHLPCGLKNGSSHQFIEQFKSFCHIHRLVQHVPEKILREARRGEVICCICQELVKIRGKSVDILWAPCCVKTWYHRNCVQKLANSAGYFCRCPACNDAKKFNEWMQRFGIFIPQQDASWELTPNAFEDLLFRYNNCDAEECKCPRGRESNTENTIWEIVLCESCGSQGIHVACGNLKFLDPEWECNTCKGITKNVNSSATETSDSNKTEQGSSKQLKLSMEVCQKKRRRSSESLENSVLDKRKKSRTALEEEEIEVDVVTLDEEVKSNDSSSGATEKEKHLEKTGHPRTKEATQSQKTDPQEVLKLLKPGPLSYKLSIIRNLWGAVPSLPERKTGGSTSSSTVVIELSDSEGEEKEEKEKEVEVIEDAAKEPHKPVSEEEEPKKGTRTEEPEEEEKKQKTQTFSLEDFEVVAVVSIQPAGKAKDEKDNPSPTPKKVNLTTNRHNPPIYFSGKTSADYQGNKSSVREDNERMQSVDDDVIILTD